MDPREFVEIRTKRYMAQALEQFEMGIEQPLRTLAASDADQRDLARIVGNIEAVKRTFRRKLKALADDCLDLMPADVEINAFEPVVRR